MINMYALKVKFVTTLLTHIKTPTKLLINYNMEYDKIVETAERMQADNARDPARGITNRGKTFYFKYGKKIRQKTPEERGRSPRFISKKNKCGFVGHCVSSWHRCLLVSLRCLSGVSWYL